MGKDRASWRGGLRTRLTLPGGGQIDYGYNARGQLTHLTDSDGQTSAFVYDRVGRLTGSERANGLTSRYQHDPAGRLRLLRHRLGNKLLASFQFEVDGRGNRVNAREIVARPATVTATLDRNHASVSYTGTWSDTGGFRRTTEFTARLSLTLSGQELRLVVGTGPDHGLCDVYVDGSLWETYDGYSPAAGERSLPFMLDKGGSHSLELRNRPDKRGVSTGYVVRFKQVDVLATSYDSQTIQYAYDALARLRQAQYYSGVGVLGSPFRQYDYAFDRSGNRTQQVVTISGVPTTTNYTYNAANQLIQAGNANLTYDSNGNMLNDGVNSYIWDRANRLLSMGGASYVYDGEGRRVKQTVSGQVTQYLLDLQPGLAVVLSAAQGANVERYIHGPTGIFARKDSANNWHWTEQDGLGTVRGEVDQFGNVEGSRTLDSFGNLIGAVNGTIGTPYGFTGELVDGGGLLDLRARRYNAAMGVFASLDILETLNRYAYTGGNPVNRVDPSGLFATLSTIHLLPKSRELAIVFSSGLCQSVQDDDCACYDDQPNSNAFFCRLGEIPNCVDRYANNYEIPTQRESAVRKTLEFLQSTYGDFPNPYVFNPENEDCEFSSNSRGVNDFVVLSNKAAELTSTLDDYLYVMNSIILRYRSSGDLGVVVSVGSSRSWASGFCIGWRGLSREYNDGTPNQISTHAWSFVASSASRSSRTGTLVGIIGNFFHDIVEGVLGMEGASWKDYILSYTSMMLGQQLRHGEISPAQFGEAFAIAVGGEASYWDFINCEQCKQLYGQYFSEWAQSQFPLGPR